MDKPNTWLKLTKNMGQIVKTTQTFITQWLDWNNPLFCMFYLFQKELGYISTAFVWLFWSFFSFSHLHLRCLWDHVAISTKLAMPMAPLNVFIVRLQGFGAEHMCVCLLSVCTPHLSVRGCVRFLQASMVIIIPIDFYFNLQILDNHLVLHYICNTHIIQTIPDR